MSGKQLCWSADAASGAVLMEYLKRASPRYVAAELDKLGLLEGADEAAATMLEQVAALRTRDRTHPHAVAGISRDRLEETLYALGFEPDQLDRKMTAVLRAHDLTCRDDVAVRESWSDRLRLLLPRLAASFLPHKRAVMVALAMCAAVVVLAHTHSLGALHGFAGDHAGQFTHLAGPTPEW